MLKRSPIFLTVAAALAVVVTPLAVLANEAPAKLNASGNQTPFDRGFIQNAGQWDRNALFYSSGPGVGVWVTSSGIKYDFFKQELTKLDFTKEMWIAPRRRSGHVVEMKFVGAEKGAKGVGTGRMAVPINFIGENGSRSAGVYDESRLIGLYGGVDLRLYRDNSYPRFDFLVAPGAQPSQIKFRFEGADGLRPGPNGSLLVATKFGEIPFAELQAFQPGSNGSKSPVSSKFTVFPDGTVGFSLGGYDRSKPLIIDPIVYSTLLGAHAGDDFGTGVATDDEGHPYLCGATATPFFPITNGAYDITVSEIDAFVTKFTTDAAGLVYSTVIGGSGDDIARRIVVDKSGRAIIAGQTLSGNFPLTPGAFRTTYSGSSEGFIARLSPNGSNLNFGTFVGGGGADNLVGLAQDANSNIYFAGSTMSSDLATTIGAFQSARAGLTEVFVGKLQTNGSLVYLTYLGGSGSESVGSVDVTSDGFAVVAGSTSSRGFPTTAGSIDRVWQQGDGYITKFNQDGTGLVFSTFLGGSATDSIANLALDRFGNVHVIGRTQSVDFPRTPGVLDSVFNPGGENFLTKIAADGSVLLFSTFLVAGGGQSELRVDKGGLSYIVGNITFPGSFLLGGETDDPDFNGPDDDTLPGDGYLQVINEAGNQVLYGSYIGAEISEVALGLHLDIGGNTYVTGYTNSYTGVGNLGFPTTPGVFKPRQHNDRFPETPANFDAWLVKYKISRQSLIANFVCAPNNVAGSARSRANITLSQAAPAGGAFISISSSDPNIARAIDGSGLPISNMFIEAGATTGGFLIETVDVLSPRSVRFAITLEGEQRTADLVVRPWLHAVVVTPPSIVGGNQARGLLTLFQAAPAGGFIVSALSSDSEKARIVVNGTPTDTFTVPAGSTEIPFVVETTGVDENPSAPDLGWGVRFKFQISSPAKNLMLERTIRVLPARLLGLTLNPSTVPESHDTVGRIVLDGKAGPSGLPVKVRATASGSAPVSFPEADIDGNILVQNGESLHAFTVRAGTVSVDSFRVIAASGGRQPSDFFARLDVQAFSMVGIQLGATTVIAGDDTTVQVQLNRAAQEVPVEINLRLNPPTGTSPYAQLEKSIATVPTGETFSELVTIQTFPTLVDRSVTVQAFKAGIGSATATLLIRGSNFTFELTPSVVIGGQDILSGRLELSAPARAGGVDLLLASSNPSVISVPDSVRVNAGETIATFQLVPVRVPSTVEVVISATFESVPEPRTLNRKIKVLPRKPGVLRLEFDPGTVLGGNPSTGKITLDGPAPTAGTVVKLTKDTTTGGAPYVSIPGQITIPVDQTQGSFIVKTVPPPAATFVRVFAQTGTQTVSGALTLSIVELDTFTIEPSEVLGGSTAIGIIKLKDPAGPGGRKVAISVRADTPGAPYVSAPGEVRASAGQQEIRFKILTTLPPETTVATLVATIGANSVEANLVIAAPQLVSMTITPSTVPGGTTAVGEVFLDRPAPFGGAVVQLSASPTSTGTAFTSFPSSVMIPEGKTSAKFNIRTAIPSRTVATTIIGAYSQNTVTAVITITR